MSTRIQEAIERDAAAAEADETPEPEPDEPSEPSEPEPEPEPAATGEPSDEQIAKFEAEATRHEKALAKIMGDDFAIFGPCATCNTVGYVPLDAPRVSPDHMQCEHCAGFGFLSAPTRNPGALNITCLQCNGQGYVSKPAPLAPVPQWQPAAPAAEPWPGHAIAFIPVPGGMEDAWRRPAGHPQWGLDPSTLPAA